MSSSYWERVRHTAALVSPLNLVSPHPHLHPETKQAIPLPLTLSAIVPANTVLDFLMIRAQQYPHPAPAVAAATLNQLYNAAHYRANRNGSSTTKASNLAAAYGAAVVGSVGVVLSLSRAVDALLPAPHPLRLLARRCVPYFGVAAADALNLSVMRRDEYTGEGVAVRHADGRPAGRSRLAGRRAVAESVAGRVAAAAPILLLPPLLLARLERREWFRARPRLHTPVLVGAVAVLLQLTVPLTLSIFRPVSSLRAGSLERASFGHLPPDERLFFYKGV